jgi:hypothetical protein
LNINYIEIRYKYEKQEKTVILLPKCRLDKLWGPVSLGHGDFWSNNMMFVVGEDGEPQNAILLDFQVEFLVISKYFLTEKYSQSRQ